MSHNFLGRQFEYVNDALSEEEKDHFAAGQCHSLACAIHRRTGWPMVALYSNEYNQESGNEGPYHIANRHPDGELVDADMKYDESDAAFFHNWQDSHAIDTDPDYVSKHHSDWGYDPMNHEAAEKAVDKMLKPKP